MNAKLTIIINQIQKKNVKKKWISKNFFNYTMIAQQKNRRRKKKNVKRKNRMKHFNDHRILQWRSWR